MVDSWAQITDVASTTGVVVDDVLLLQAQAIIEMFAGRTYEATVRIGSRDIGWLRRAVSYQAAWMASQPDLYTRLDFAGITMGGRAVALKNETLLIAPLAKLAMSKVSWRRSRSLHVRSPFTDGMSPVSSDPDSAGNDAYEQWSAM